jgi:hypothetical protein
LTWKVCCDTANEFKVGKANIVEGRRLMWTTSYNLKVWFDCWKTMMVELGSFARKIGEAETSNTGELVFFPDQCRRILNFDETEASLHDTKHLKGGHSTLTFHSNSVSGGGTSVNKSGHSSLYFDLWIECSWRSPSSLLPVEEDHVA